MRLTENFTLSELTRTDTGLFNEPMPPERDKLFLLCRYILQPLRDEWGVQKVNSGYRSEGVERKVAWSGFLAWCRRRGLKPDEDSWMLYFVTKQHPRGEAADVAPREADIEVVFDWIVTASGIRFGQAILEKKGPKENWWIHMSLPRQGRPDQEALVYEAGRYRPYVVSA